MSHGITPVGSHSVDASAGGVGSQFHGGELTGRDGPVAGLSLLAAHHDVAVVGHVGSRGLTRDVVELRLREQVFHLLCLKVNEFGETVG